MKDDRRRFAVDGVTGTTEAATRRWCHRPSSSHGPSVVTAHAAAWPALDRLRCIEAFGGFGARCWHAARSATLSSWFDVGQPVSATRDPHICHMMPADPGTGSRVMP